MKKIKIEKAHHNHLIEGRGERLFNACMNVFGILLSFIVFYPIWYTLIASVSRPFYVSSGDVVLWPIEFTLQSYVKAFATKNLWTSYGNTIFYTVVGVLVSMLFTTTMAYALSRKRLALRKFWTLFVVFTMWFNAGLIPTYMNFRNLKLLDTRTAIVLGFAMSAYELIIMKSFFEQIPESLEEAAFIDGASNVGVFARIFLPLSAPALATIGMFFAVSRWNGYFWAMNLLKSDDLIPLQVLLKKVIVDQTANATDAGVITVNSLTGPTTIIYALIILAIIPMLVVYPFVQKYFKSGMTIGAVKG